MKLIYIAGPYRAKSPFEQNRNIAEAELMAQYYWKRGYAVICPHLNSRNFDGLIPDEQFLTGMKVILVKCDTIAFHPNWEASVGSLAEYDLAKILNIPMLFPVMKTIRRELSK